MPDSRNEVTLKVGESLRIKRSFFGESLTVIYAGMPDALTYSVVVNSASGYQAMAYNLFLPADSRKIRVGQAGLIVTYVAPDEIRFTVER